MMSNSPIRPTMSAHRVGDYRRVAAAARTQAPQAPVTQSATAPAVPALPAPVRPASTASGPGFFSRLIEWLRSLFQPAPTPTPNPVPPTPVPPTPVPPTPQPSTGLKVYFTNTYNGTIDGRSNEQVRAANEAAAKADPNNPDKQLVALIDSVGPGGTLDGAFFDIEVDNVVEALVRASQRGVKVRLTTESDYYYQPNSQALRAPIQRLQAAGIAIRPDERPGGLMHDKFLIANGQTVWTGSYNITTGGSYAENNNALRIDSAELAGEFQKEFDKMFVAGNFGTDTANGNPDDDHPAPKTVNVGGASITTYFSPSKKAQAGAREALLAELAQARTSIQFLAFSFTDDEIANVMVERANAGVRVEGVFEKSQAASRYSEYKRLNPLEAPGGNIDVRIDTNPALMHHKVMIIDDSTLVMGSFNFSASAAYDNDENMLIIKNAPDLVKAYKEEFARVQAVANN